jgi:hypothetical protein
VDPPGLPVWIARATILLIAGAIAMGETNRLVTGALTPAGESRAVTDVIGMTALSGTDAWSDWADLFPEGMRGLVAGWIFFHALFDIALYLGYWLLLRGLVSPFAAARRALRLLLTLEIVETALLWLGSVLLYLGGVPGLFRWSLAVVATVKWLTGAFLVIAALVDDGLRRRIGQGVVRIIPALWEQRLSLVVVAVVGVLSLVPLPNIWDQLPDVERSWVDGDPGDVWHPVWAVIAIVVVSLYLFVIGRLRSERVWTTRVGNRPPEDLPKWWWWWCWWIVPPVLALATAVLLTALFGDGLVDWQNVVLVVAVPLVILALSGLVLLYDRHRESWQQRLRQQEPQDLKWWQRLLLTDGALAQKPTAAEERDRAKAVWVAGDVLAVSVVVIAGLGLIRSLTAPVLLGRPEEGGLGIWSLRVAVLLAGAVVALGAFPLAQAGVDRLDRDELPADAHRSWVKRLLSWVQRPLRPYYSWVKRLLRPYYSWVKRLLRPYDNSRPGRPHYRRAIALILLVPPIATLGVLMVYPLELTRWFGVVATTLLALGLWAAVLGLLIVQLQHYKPLPIFSALGMRTTPVLTLLLVFPLLASQAGGDPDVFALSGPPGGAPAAIPNRPSLSEAFTDWLDRSHGCDRLIDATDGQTVRPMVLVAASGGGIRSAVWTARVMDGLRASGDCASQAVFLSSGLSGGSVGLALSRGEDPIGDAEELAEPDALAAGIVGTLVGDIIASSSGLRIPSRSLLDEDGNEPAGRERWDWRDRAGLMEAAWEAKAESLTARFDQRLSGPAGVLVMNSTAAGRDAGSSSARSSWEPVPNRARERQATPRG